MAQPHKGPQGLPYPTEPTMPEQPHDPEDSKFRLKRQLTFKTIGVLKDPYAALQLVNTVLLIDDSASMQECWDEVRQILQIIGPICTQYDNDGITIEFVNHRASGYHFSGRSGYKHIGETGANCPGQVNMSDNIIGIMNGVKKPKGKCVLNRRLKDIINPYINDVENMLRDTGGKYTPVALNVIVVTGMLWEDEDENPFKGVLGQTAGKLDKLGVPAQQMGVQFFCVGEGGRRLTGNHVRFLDDLIWKRMGVRDMVDLTTWTGKPGELSPEGRLKVVLGGLRRSIDFLEV
ncbi:hypothetical protein GGS20DRAFT_591682 [Poronia punctata]|nr:hypothetical protein GGS20DRAFT_591682 [Poronia punctata]